MKKCVYRMLILILLLGFIVTALGCFSKQNVTGVCWNLPMYDAVLCGNHKRGIKINEPNETNF